MRHIFFCFCCWLAALGPAAADELVLPNGPPPRFVILHHVKDEKAFFDVTVAASSDNREALQYPDGSTRTVGSRGYVHTVWWTPLGKARWRNCELTQLDADTVWKNIKPGTIVLLSADGALVDADYLRMFNKETLVLTVPAEILPESAVSVTSSSAFP